MRFGNDVNFWLKSESLLDVSRGARVTTTIDLVRDMQLRFNPQRSAMVIIDMQNYFGASELERGTGAIDLVPAIKMAVSSARRLGMRVSWVNWGNRPDLANLPPSLIYSFKKHINGCGIGDELPNELGRSLIKDTWSTALLNGLEDSYEEDDWWIDKYRPSGFPGTVLDATLRANGIDTLFFAGVNTDQCVWGTFLDAVNLGYDCVLLKDCTATTSPSYCYDAVVYNITRQSGLVTEAANLAVAASKENGAD